MIPLAELKGWLESPDGDDTVVQDLAERAAAFLERQSGRYFGPLLQRTVRLDGPGTDELWLDEAPVVDAGAVPPMALVVEERSGDTWTTVDPLEYEAVGAVLFREDVVWDCGRRNFRVTFWSGYEWVNQGTFDLAVPDDVRQAVLDLVALKYRGRGAEGLQSEEIGGYRASRPAHYAFSEGDLKMVPGLLATIESWRWRRV